MKLIKLFLLLLPIISISQQKFNSFREQLIENKKYEYVYNFENNYAVFRTFKGKMGLIDTVGNVIIKPNYEYINNKKGLKNLFEAAINVSKKYKRGFIDLKGNVKIPFEYDDVYYFDNGLIRVTKNNKTGVIDTLNKPVLPLKFEYIMSQDNILFTQSNNTQDIFDSTGKQLTNFKAKDVEYFTANKSIVTLQNNNTLIINNQGNIILNTLKNHKFEKIINTDSYIILNTLTKKKGIINSLGKYEVECKYDDISPSKSVYIAKTKNKYGFVTKEDSILKPFIYDAIYDVNYTDNILFENQYFASIGDLKGIVNPFLEKEIIPIRYKYIQPFSNYYIVASPENKNGLFSENGETIIKEDYEFYNASQNKIFASKNNKNYLLTLLDKTYSEIEIPVDKFVSEHLFVFGTGKSRYQIFKNGNKFGVISNENKIVIPCEFDSIKDSYSKTEFIAMKDKKYGIVNVKNQVMVDLKYDTYIVLKESIRFETKNQKEKKSYSFNFLAE
ncbi:hypothetical protein AR687_21225 [Flavobacteriaceae bacterium CRH]|nr:hypothetical protein AR687_21225 [Flavobacteriaceae bacterium CRH]